MTRCGSSSEKEKDWESRTGRDSEEKVSRERKDQMKRDEGSTAKTNEDKDFGDKEDEADKDVAPAPEIRVIWVNINKSSAQYDFPSRCGSVSG